MCMTVCMIMRVAMVVVMVDVCFRMSLSARRSWVYAFCKHRMQLLPRSALYKLESMLDNTGVEQGRQILSDSLSTSW